MKDGYILQTGTPVDLYENPVDVFTARFIGSPSMNMLPASTLGTQPGFASEDDVIVGIRPHDLLAVVDGAMPESAILTFEGVVEAVEPLGPETMVHLNVAGASLIATSPGTASPEVGSSITCTVEPGKLYLFDATTEKSLGRR